MTTEQIVTAVAEQTGISKAKAKEVLTTAFDTMVKAAAEGGDARFGKHRFVKKTTPAGSFYNIQTGKIETKPEKTTVRYKMAV